MGEIERTDTSESLSDVSYVRRAELEVAMHIPTLARRRSRAKRASHDCDKTVNDLANQCICLESAEPVYAC